MKRISLILNIVLAVAVIALYVFHFTGIGTSAKSTNEAGFTPGILDGSDIFYVQIDSVISNFDMATDLSSNLKPNTIPRKPH